jgi:hypothetical protein
VINDVSFGQGLFVAVGASGTMTTSTDGITWTARTAGFSTTAINDGGYNGGTYVIVGAAGKMATSTVSLTLDTLLTPVTYQSI